MDWIKSNLWEIKRSSSLRWLGFIFSLTHIYLFLSWLNNFDNPIKYYTEPTQMCWGFIENCHFLKFLTPGQFKSLFYFYPILAGLSALFFASVRLYFIGWFLLVFTFIINGFLYFQDFRLTSNAQYIVFITQFAYLFIPQKKILMRYIPLSIILCLGFYKLNTIWLSGTFFSKYINLPPKITEWISLAFLGIELFAPWFLFSTKRQRVFISFFTLVIFYLSQFFIFQVQYGVIISTLLTYFPFYYSEKRKIEMEYLYQSFIRPEASMAWVYLFLLTLWTVQILPFYHWKEPKHRLVVNTLAFTPMSKVKLCAFHAYALYKNKSEELKIDLHESDNDILKCNPLVVFNQLKSKCVTYKKDNDFVAIRASFSSKKADDQNYSTIFESDQLCDENMTFNLLGNSGWTLKLEN